MEELLDMWFLMASKVKIFDAFLIYKGTLFDIFNGSDSVQKYKLKRNPPLKGGFQLKNLLLSCPDYDRYTQISLNTMFLSQPFQC